jgi:hypothetical protein
MAIQAWLVGLVCGGSLGAIGIAIAILSRRWIQSERATFTFVLSSFWIAAIVLLPAPMIRLIEMSGVSLADPGHAAANFALPYLASSVGSLILGGLIAIRPHPNA